MVTSRESRVSKWEAYRAGASGAQDFASLSFGGQQMVVGGGILGLE